MEEIDNVLEKAARFASSNRFTLAVQNFQDKNASHFCKLCETKGCDYDITHTAIFEEYQNLLEGLFDEFAHSSDISSVTLYNQCRDAGWQC